MKPDITIHIGETVIRPLTLYSDPGEEFNKLLEDIRVRVEEHFYHLAIEITDLKIENRVMVNVDCERENNTLISVDNRRYEVKIFFGEKGRYMLTTFMVDEKTDLFNMDWYLVDLKLYNRSLEERIFISGQHSFTGSLNSCIKIIKGELDR